LYILFKNQSMPLPELLCFLFHFHVILWPLMVEVGLVAWRNGNAFRPMNKVTLRRARLIL